MGGAKLRVHHANRRLTGAHANLRAARNNLKVQIRNAKRVRNQCRCRVQARTARALKAAKRLTGDRMKTLLREMMVKCLVAARRHGKNANKVAARCKNLRVSAGYKRRLRLFRTRLAPGVAAARCGAVGWSIKRKVICHQKYWHVSHKSPDQCKALCNKTPGCRANGFSYVSQWRQCRLPRANVPCKAWHYHIGAFYRKVARNNARYTGKAWCETFHTCRGGDKRNFWAWVKNQGYKMYKGACSARKNTRTYGRRHKYWGGKFTYSQCKAKCDRMGRNCEGITMPMQIKRVRL